MKARGGGFDASQDDFEIPVGVTEMDQEKKQMKQLMAVQ